MNNLKLITKYTIVFLIIIGCSSDNPIEENSGDVLVSSIVISGNNIEDGTSTQLRVEIFPSNASKKTVTWIVSDESIATISNSGLLTAVNNGEVTVTVTAKDASVVSVDKVFSVAGVTQPPVLVESITISGSDIVDGNPLQLSADVLPVNADNKEITWSVSDADLAEINEDGLLTPKANGTVTVKATATDGSNTFDELQINISGVSTIPGVGTSQEILNAIASANAGDIIYVIEGNYTFATTINISRNGSMGSVISILPHPNNTSRPKFDFSSMSESSSNRGISLSGNYWNIKGIDVFGAGDNGMFISGSDNLIEFCTFSECKDTGLQIGNGGSNNTILNCDSYFNADSTLENADGFACKLDAGTGNKFIGCRAWQNLDDGWDGYLRGADNITTTYENCWAIKNGYLKDGSAGAGDGNGFKTGGSDDKLLKHNAIYKNCIAAGNIVDGFDHNSNRGDVELYNCGSYSNGRNISFSNSNIANSLTIKNTVSLSGSNNNSLSATTTDITNNSWQNGIVANASDYVSLNMDLLTSARKEDGSLPDIDFMKLVTGSDLIDAGVDVGLSFNGASPDIGPFEK
ncbi:Ig-like domain-containing protein [Flaviramulus sp. BrNp1-15]|uniref:Ig-like domain-containing protein n=1 Tax=Flaviramulus sp. BrNp1-15 TaxID=2916754 RepID=UPI001EE8FAAD|nr:Ig-like domain-containing protein [Flaviramulus sp. BrNp1-15]ULC59036.1 Ig-like domain-containing protein [Flaviramulus sp. BrNp1-15]